MFHLFFCNIAGQSSASAVGEQDVKITPMISDKKDRFIGNIFFSDDSGPDSCDLQYAFESPLDDAQ